MYLQYHLTGSLLFFSQQPVRQIPDLDAIIVSNSEPVSGQNDLLIVVTYIHRRLHLTIKCLFRSHICRDLEICVGSLLITAELIFEQIRIYEFGSFQQTPLGTSPAGGYRNVSISYLLKNTIFPL